MDAFEILVIILSITLAILLILTIIAVSLTIQLLKKANRAADYVEATTANLAAVSDTMRSASGPAALIRAISGLLHK